MQTPNSAQSRLDLLLFGAPGSGKGTQAVHLVKEFGLPHIATGDLFRENLKQQTELGKLAKSYMDKGQLVPDDVTTKMLKDRLARPDVAKGFVLDGFPRTLPQAEALAQLLAEMNRRIVSVLYLNVSDEVIVSRLAGRLICRACQTPFHLKNCPPKQTGVCDKCGGQLYQRDDDKPETVHARLKVFHNQTSPLLDYYRKAGVITEIDGAAKLADIKASMFAAVKKAAKI